MDFKKGGLLERTINANANKGVCKTCSNLVKISDTTFACIEHDKFIMPKFLPYHGNSKCKDWKA